MKHIGIFCGGFSSEYEISLKSAETIINNLPNSYLGIKIIVSKNNWEVQHNNYSGHFDLNTGLVHLSSGESIKIDGAIIYIHGDPGENGKIQALFDILGIPYINSNVLASALSFDKWFCNQFLKSFGIPVAQSIQLKKGQTMNPNLIVKELGLPLFIKPTDSGSSYGISKVTREDEIPQALVIAFNEGDTVVIESFLNGIEVTCGVYRNGRNTIALPLTEIVSDNEFFDYDAKYNGKSNEITPARIPNDSTTLIQTQSKQIYELLGLKSIARIDFMLVDKVPYLIEVNTTPGFSSESIVPKMLKEAQISIKEFWGSILMTELP